MTLPNYIDREMWSAFVETRKAMKVPFTPAAEKLIVRKLMRMHADGWDVNASLEKSAIYGYRGVFEVSRRGAKTADEIALEVAKEREQFASRPSEEIRRKIAELTGRA